MSSSNGNLLTEDSVEQSAVLKAEGTLVIRLGVPELVHWWAMLESPLKKGLVKHDERVMANVHANLLDGLMHCWVVTTRGSIHKPLAVMLTGISVDMLVGIKNLIVYGLFSLEHVENEVWSAVFSILEDFGRGQRCDRILAYTNSDRVIEIAEQAGASADLVLIEKDISK